MDTESVGSDADRNQVEEYLAGWWKDHGEAVIDNLGFDPETCFECFKDDVVEKILELLPNNAE
jgi:hypothetical protein